MVIPHRIYETKSLKASVCKGVLTHISLASFLWDIGKHNNPRCDAAKRGIPSGAILFAYTIFIKKIK